MVARFDGGRLSSDGGLLVLREIEQRLKVADRLAACIGRSACSRRHRAHGCRRIRFRLLMIAAGYADGNDATSLQTPQVPRLPVVLEMNFHAFGHA